MLGPSAADSFGDGLEELLDAGAAIVTGAQRGGGQGYCFQNTLLRTTGDEFIADPEKLQTEIFGNGALVVTASGPDQMAEICTHFEVRRRAPPPHSPVVYLTAFGGAGQPDGLHLLLHARLRRRTLLADCAGAAQPRRPSAQRQDANRCCRLSGHEPRCVAPRQ